MVGHLRLCVLGLVCVFFVLDRFDLCSRAAESDELSLTKLKKTKLESRLNNAVSNSRDVSEKLVVRDSDFLKFCDEN